MTRVPNPFKLTPRELLFVEAWCGPAHCKAGPAYRMAGFRGTPSVASSGGFKLLRKPRVAEAIAVKFAERVARLRVMGGDEALERLTLYARADIGKVLGPDDPLAKLPDEIRLCIKSVRPHQFGRVVELHDAMKAAETLAKVAGKLVEKHEVHMTLEEIIAGSYEPDEGPVA